ncbi:MAG: hypothetical protein PHI73_02980 [Patescibacteria group bacterium]|nr:hypothetical protein [Patescibacteria group bacterium]
MAKSKLYYFAQVRDGLQAAGVDLSQFYEYARTDDHSGIEGRVIGLLKSHAFSLPQDLASQGYPAAAISQAETTAKAMVRQVTDQIISIWQEFQGGESHS